MRVSEYPVQSASNPNVYYKVTHRVEGADDWWTCGCEAFKNQPNKWCKHIIRKSQAEASPEAVPDLSDLIVRIDRLCGLIEGLCAILEARND